MENAACRGMDTSKFFFPEKNDNNARNEAVKTCFSCPVLKECRDFRKRTGSKYGIWAGVNHKPNDKEQQ